MHTHLYIVFLGFVSCLSFTYMKWVGFLRLWAKVSLWASRRAPQCPPPVLTTQGHRPVGDTAAHSLFLGRVRPFCFDFGR